MSNLNIGVLKDLDEDDIEIISKNADLNNMLQPIIHNQKHYANYIRLLGRLEKKSKLVQKNLPRIAFELYNKGDNNYQKFFAISANNLKISFEETLKECLGKNIEPRELSSFTIKDYRALFSSISKLPGTSFNIELFFLQSKMFGIEFNDEMKDKINQEWIHYQDIENLKIEMQTFQNKELEAKEKEYHDKISEQKKKFKGNIAELKSSIESLENDSSLQEEKIEILNCEKKKFIDDANKYSERITEKEEEIKELNLKISELEENLELEIKKNGAKKEDIFDDIEKIWKNKNDKKIQIRKELEGEIGKKIEIKDTLNKKNKELKAQIKKWEKHIENYFDVFDQKIIDHRIDSLLYKNNEKEIDTVSNKEKKTSIDIPENLYICKGYKVVETEPCIDYEDYKEIVEDNFSSMGGVKSINSLVDCFNAAIGAGLYPLICGFEARQTALALTASRYSEKPEIISIQGGFTNSSVLINLIDNVKTDSVIIEDAFGAMNERTLLPLLREENVKNIIFTAESIEEIKYLPEYFYNYIQLIVVNKKSIYKKVEFQYSYGDKIFEKKIHDKRAEGYKTARKTLGDIGMSESYILNRGNLLCEMLEYNTCKEALESLVTAELKYIIEDGKKEKLEELINTYSEKAVLLNK